MTTKIEWMPGMDMHSVKWALISSCYDKLRNKTYVAKELGMSLRGVRNWLRYFPEPPKKKRRT